MSELVRISKKLEFLEGKCTVALNRLVSKYAPYTAFSLLKLKSEFHNNKLKSIKKDPNGWISNFEGLQMQMSEKEYDVIF